MDTTDPSRTNPLTLKLEPTLATSIEALRDIREDEQICVTYGEMYWSEPAGDEHAGPSPGMISLLGKERHIPVEYEDAEEWEEPEIEEMDDLEVLIHAFTPLIITSRPGLR